MIKIIEKDDYFSNFYPIMQQLIVDSKLHGLNDPHFTEHVPHRRIIYPCDAHLDYEFILAIENILRVLNDTLFFIDFIGGTTYSDRCGEIQTTPDRYCISIDDFQHVLWDEGIAKLVMNKNDPFLFFSDWVGFSLKKSLSIFICAESRYAVIGGTQEAIQLLDNNMPDYLENSLKNFLLFYRPILKLKEEYLNNLDYPTAWIIRLLIQTYGKDDAIKLLYEHNMFFD